MRFFFSRIMPDLFILFGAVALYFGSTDMRRAQDSLKWPTAEGKIESSSVQFHRGKKGGGTYHAEVRYTFTAAGKTHNGIKVAYGDYGASNPAHAQAIVSRYPKGKIVSVYYLASDPDVCVLEPGLKTQAWFLPGVGLIFIVAGILMVIYFPRAFIRQKISVPGNEGNTLNCLL